MSQYDIYIGKYIQQENGIDILITTRCFEWYYAQLTLVNNYTGVESLLRIINYI